MRKEDVLTAVALLSPVIVFVVFLTLKLTSVISWPWLWVMSPLWIIVTITIVMALIYIAVFYYRYRKFTKK